MKIKPGLCSIFYRPFTLKIILGYLRDIEVLSARKFPVEFDTKQEEDEPEAEDDSE